MSTTASETPPRQPGRERAMERRPGFTPRNPGSARLKGKVAVRVMSFRLADRGIRVNGIAPLIRASFPAEKVETFGQNVPPGRPSQPNEVAWALLFLARAGASCITGQAIHRNGGTLVRG